MGIAQSLMNLAIVADKQGDHRAAQAWHEQSLALHRKLGNKEGIATSLHYMGHAAFLQGDYETARAFYEQSLTMRKELEGKSGIVLSLEAFARLTVTTQQPKRAARLWGAAEAMRQATGSPISPIEQAEYDHNLDIIREALGAEAFAAAWEEGRAMTLEQVTVYALEDPGTPVR